MSSQAHIERVEPANGMSGGEGSIEFARLSPNDAQTLSVKFEGSPAHVTAAAHKRALVLVRNRDGGGDCEVSLSIGEEPKAVGQPRSFVAGKKLAGGIHPVTNPVFDPSDDSLFVTRSGSRGEHVPTSLYRIRADGEIEEFSGDIMNPTAMAFDKNGQMLVTSRFDGTVYRVSPVREVSVF